MELFVYDSSPAVVEFSIVLLITVYEDDILLFFL
jgi:hypothetical protein